MRSVLTEHANPKAFASGEGAAVSGGRWSPIGMRAAYFALDPRTAAAESFQGFKAYGSTCDVPPRVFVGTRVTLSGLLDLTSASVRRMLGFSLRELLEEDWLTLQLYGEESWTQAIGRGAKQSGFEGLLARSAVDRPKGVNLVVFPESLLAGSHLTPMGLRDLPE